MIQPAQHRHLVVSLLTCAVIREICLHAGRFEIVSPERASASRAESDLVVFLVPRDRVEYGPITGPKMSDLMRQRSWSNDTQNGLANCRIRIPKSGGRSVIQTLIVS